MSVNQFIKFTIRSTLIFRVCHICLFSALSACLFWVITLTTSDINFLSNQFTGGSDDYMYLDASIKATAIDYGYSLSEILDVFYDFSLHSPGYPIILFSLFSLFGSSIYVGILLNSIFLWISIHLSSAIGGWGQNSRFIKLPFVLATMPGLLLVSFYLYKDLILLTLILLAIVNYHKKNYILAVLFLILTNFFRPFNGILMLVSLLLAERPKIGIASILICCFLSLIYPELMNLQSIQTSIEFSQSIAIRDMESYGSNYVPSGIFWVDYLVGLFRFFLLPFPFSIGWDSRPGFYSLLVFLQSLIIYLTLLIGVLFPNTVIKTMKEHKILFMYAFLQGSIYSIIFFGNSEPRYRLVMYVCVGILIHNLWLNLKTKSRRQPNRLLNNHPSRSAGKPVDPFLVK